jgi:hypothetical protein
MMYMLHDFPRVYDGLGFSFEAGVLALDCHQCLG